MKKPLFFDGQDSSVADLNFEGDERATEMALRFSEIAASFGILFGLTLSNPGAYVARVAAGVAYDKDGNDLRLTTGDSDPLSAAPQDISLSGGDVGKLITASFTTQNTTSVDHTETGAPNDTRVTSYPTFNLRVAPAPTNEVVLGTIASIDGSGNATFDTSSAQYWGALLSPAQLFAMQDHDDGVLSGLVTSTAGGLTVDVTSGVVIVNGARARIPAPTTITLGDNTLTYLYVDGSVLEVLATTDPTIALSTAGNVPIAVVLTATGVVTSIKDIRRFVEFLDDKLIVTIGSDPAFAHFTSIQSAMDWYVAYTTAASPQTPKGAIFWLKTDVTLTTPVLFNGVSGITLMSTRRAAQAQANPVGGQIRWSYDGVAFDLGGANDCTFDGLHFRQEAIGGAMSGTNCFGNPSTVAIGENITVRNCSTQSMAGQTANLLRRFISVNTGTAKSWIIENNTVDVTDAGIFTVGGYVRCHIAKNVIKCSGAPSGALAVTLGISDTNTNLTIDTEIIGNWIHPPASAGVLAGDSTGFAIAIAVNPSSDRIIVSKNIISGGSAGGTTGIEADGSHTIVEGNIINLPTGTGSTTGITVASTSTGPRIVKNFIKSLETTALVRGIRLTGNVGGALVEGNDIDLVSTSATGIQQISTIASGDQILDNTVSCSAVTGSTLGISVAGLKMFVQENEVFAPSVSGVCVQLGSGTRLCSVSDNQITGTDAGGSTDTGISINGNGHVISDNIFANIGNGTSGFVIDLNSASQDCAIRGNIAQNQIANGIRVKGTGHTVDGNIIGVGPGNGIVVQTAASISLTGNIINTTGDTPGYKIFSDASIVTITGGQVLIGSVTSVGSAIEVNGPDWTITGVLFQVSGSDGAVVRIGAGRGNLTGCKFLTVGTTLSPILFSAAAPDVVITGNTFKGGAKTMLNNTVFATENLNFSGNIINVTTSDVPFAFGFAAAKSLVFCNNIITLVGTVVQAVGIMLVGSAQVSAKISNNEFDLSGSIVSNSGDLFLLQMDQGSFAKNKVTFSNLVGGTTLYRAVHVTGSGGVSVEGNNLDVLNGLNTSAGIFLDATAGVQVIGNVILTSGGGYGVLNSGSTLSTIMGNLMTIALPTSSSAMVDVQGAANLTIATNTFNGIGGGHGIFMHASGCVDVAITGNVFIGATGSGAGIKETLGASVKNVTVMGNTMNMGGVGLFTTAGSAGLAIGNYLEHASDASGWSTVSNFAGLNQNPT